MKRDSDIVDEITVLRDGRPPLRFVGECIGQASSQRDGKRRWFEVEIYRTDAGGYVVAGAGVSEFEDEDDRCWAYAVKTPEEVVSRLELDELRCVECDNERVHRGKPCSSCGSYVFEETGGRFITRTAQLALEQAAETDAAFDRAYAVEI